MRILVIALGLVVALPSPVFALCRGDQQLTIVGTLATDSAVIASAAKKVRLIAVTCGGSACLAGIYDTTTPGGTGTATARFEISGAANETVFFPPSGFAEQPMNFTSGVTFVDNGNVAAVSVFECAD